MVRTGGLPGNTTCDSVGSTRSIGSDTSGHFGQRGSEPAGAGVAFSLVCRFAGSPGFEHVIAYTESSDKRLHVDTGHLGPQGSGQLGNVPAGAAPGRRIVWAGFLFWIACMLLGCGINNISDPSGQRGSEPAEAGLLEGHRDKLSTLRAGPHVIVSGKSSTSVSDSSPRTGLELRS